MRSCFVAYRVSIAVRHSWSSASSSSLIAASHRTDRVGGGFRDGDGDDRAFLRRRLS
ncbi:Hypothetical protein UVM_LOCUS168 [uncultured virus]|nr:Hypothetical protein UVM_LOCUS168 [uncultured virus]